MNASMDGVSDRTNLFLGSLTRTDGTELAAQLADCAVELEIEEGADNEIAGALAASLMLRMGDAAPRLHLIARDRHVDLPGLGSGPLIDELAQVHAQLPGVERLVADPASDPIARIKIGRVGAPRALSIGASGWLVGLGCELGPDSGNPIAAAFAGVLASAHGVSMQLGKALGPNRQWSLESPLRVSLWDLAVDGGDGPTLADAVDLSAHCFVGCGGVASATIWTLALLPLVGRPTLIDHDAIDDAGTNLNRHLFATAADLGTPKVHLAAVMLDRAGAAATPVVDRWPMAEAPVGMSTAVVTVDDDAVRHDVQRSMPRLLLNAGTGDREYVVSVHDFVNGACVSCLHRADQLDSDPIASAARHLGVTRDVLRRSVETGDAIRDDDFPPEVAQRVRESLVGRCADELIQDVCGGLRLSEEAPSLSAPMLSAAPGVLLAGELVKQQLVGAPALLSGQRLMAAPFRGPHRRWVRGFAKRSGCECSDDVYRDFYREKWS